MLEEKERGNSYKRWAYLPVKIFGCFTVGLLIFKIYE